MSIEVRHVSKTFGGHTALRDVNLRVDAGELVALLGPSGSGKTTLLRIIAGLESPDDSEASQILFHDADVLGVPVKMRQVGFVFQHYALFRHMTVFDNIAFGLRVRPWKLRPPKAEIRERVHRLLDLIQLPGIEARYPAQLSGGQRQRVALARALAVEPKVLLLDEPFGALDAKVRQGLRAWLRKLHDEIHLTSILVTHDQDEALEVADRVVVMNQARIEQVGAPDEVFHHPASEFVMNFLGHVNVFHGRARDGRAQVGDIVIDCPDYPDKKERDATVYMRPHELELARITNGRPSLAAQVCRVHPAGALARVILTQQDGKELQVDLPIARFHELAIAPGDMVFVQPKHARVFIPDYVI